MTKQATTAHARVFVRLGLGKHNERDQRMSHSISGHDLGAEPPSKLSNLVAQKSWTVLHMESATDLSLNPVKFFSRFVWLSAIETKLKWDSD
jgi:hypothetical protein